MSRKAECVGAVTPLVGWSGHSGSPWVAGVLIFPGLTQSTLISWGASSATRCSPHECHQECDRECDRERHRDVPGRSPVAPGPTSGVLAPDGVLGGRQEPLELEAASSPQRGVTAGGD